MGQRLTQHRGATQRHHKPGFQIGNRRFCSRKGVGQKARQSPDRALTKNGIAGSKYVSDGLKCDEGVLHKPSRSGCRRKPGVREETGAASSCEIARYLDVSRDRVFPTRSHNHRVGRDTQVLKSDAAESRRSSVGPLARLP